VGSDDVLRQRWERVSCGALIWLDRRVHTQIEWIRSRDQPGAAFGVSTTSPWSLRDGELTITTSPVFTLAPDPTWIPPADPLICWATILTAPGAGAGFFPLLRTLRDGQVPNKDAKHR